MSNLWWKPNRTTTWPILLVESTPKLKLNYCDLSNRVWSMMKPMQENDVTDSTNAVHVKNEINLSWPIEPGAVCDENQTGYRHDGSYSSFLLLNQNWIIKTYLTKCDLWLKPDMTITWLIIQLHSMLEMILNCHDWSNLVSSLMKTS